MEKEYEAVLIRNASSEDANQLMQWWNDGRVMEHAGFPKGLGITEERLCRQLASDSDATGRHLIILYNKVPVGEMNYTHRDEKTCEIGIKICNADYQNRGIGKICLSLLIDSLFHDFGYQRICLDTNLTNLRAQHVYEQLGFAKLRVNPDSWTDQLGNLQSSVDYELTEDHFRSFL